MLKPARTPQIRRRHRTDPTRRLGRADERVQAELNRRPLRPEPAADLDRLTGAVERRADRQAGRNRQPHYSVERPDGTKVATAKFEFNQGYVTVTIETTGTGQLSPGFHGVHIHSVGKCEANSVAPTGGAPGDFLSAGGHFHAGHGEHASGDLTSLQVRNDGGGDARDHHRRVHQSRPAWRCGNLDRHPRRRRQLRQHPGGPLQPGQRRTRTRRDDDVDW